MIIKQFTEDDVYDVIDDLQRVEDNIDTLQTMVSNVLFVNIRINKYKLGEWQREHFVYTTEIERIRDNLERLCKVIEQSYQIPILKVLIDYNDVNSLEKGMKFIDDYCITLIKTLSQPLAGFYYANMAIKLVA
ncbi:hypothetical protein [Anaerorhabdus sp.]|uniref:hypothetical protein n=1 Tax=Anaerorhabdus sp. TaxID=1872524 RepID=UPI002FCC626A